MNCKFHEIRPYEDKTYIILSVKEFDMANSLDSKYHGKTVSATFKDPTTKRSLNSNAYMWELLSEMASVLRTSKEEVYEEMLRRYGSEETFATYKEVDVSNFFKRYKLICDQEQDGKMISYYRVFKGSSEMDTKEMSVLIDGIVSECKELGIDVDTEEKRPLYDNS